MTAYCAKPAAKFKALKDEIEKLKSENERLKADKERLVEIIDDIVMHMPTTGEMGDWREEYEWEDSD